MDAFAVAVRKGATYINLIFAEARTGFIFGIITSNLDYCLHCGHIPVNILSSDCQSPLVYWLSCARMISSSFKAWR